MGMTAQPSCPVDLTAHCEPVSAIDCWEARACVRRLTPPGLICHFPPIFTSDLRPRAATVACFHVLLMSSVTPVHLWERRRRLPWTAIRAGCQASGETFCRIEGDYRNIQTEYKWATFIFFGHWGHKKLCHFHQLCWSLHFNHETRKRPWGWLSLDSVHWFCAALEGSL